MADETPKTPWQLEHERQIAQVKEEEAIAERARRIALLRRAKLPVALAKNRQRRMEALEEKKQESEKQEISNQLKNLNQPALSYQEDGLKREDAVPNRTTSYFSKSLPVLRQMWLPLTLFVLLFAGSAYVLSPLNRIGTFSVSGDNRVSAQSIAAASQIRMNDSIYKIFSSKKSIEAKIVSSSQRIEKADVEISLPNKITLKVTEYAQIGYIKQSGKNYVLLGNGIIVKEATVPDSQITGSDLVLQDFSDSEAKQFATAYQSLKPEIQKLIQLVTHTPSQASKDFITLAMSDGNQVKVPLSQMGQKLPYYTNVAKNVQSPATIDMEVGIFSASTPQYDSTFSGNTTQSSSSSTSSNSSSSSDNSDGTTNASS